ncbi:VOC family protein [Arthrobacter sp. zg-Y826]|uniref:VOC family protein n=1 Tax=Arthrobacter jinronghuae TaxID=2964609 RepID=UPI002107F635|nr:VOC family protein [Arthrobacter jinronghuae]MCQ1957063.1 VOC family protein [Arthrobacter jinronghuae]
MRLHHVQVSIPKRGEDQARRFYGEALGLTEVDKPPSLAGRGGCWFRAFDGEDVVAEIGVESPFVPAKKAHPALMLDSAKELEELGARISTRGFEASWTDRYTFVGDERFHCKDPFGNRVEILSPPAG